MAQTIQEAVREISLQRKNWRLPTLPTSAVLEAYQKSKAERKELLERSSSSRLAAQQRTFKPYKSATQQTVEAHRKRTAGIKAASKRCSTFNRDLISAKSGF